MEFKERFEDYTEVEFREFIRCFFENERNLSPDAFEDFLIKGVLHFAAITEYPSGYDILLRPAEPQEKCINRVVDEVVNWRLTNNKPGFKSE